MQLIFQKGYSVTRKPVPPLPRNQRAKTPPKMQLTDEDIDLLTAIWRYEGVVTVPQLSVILGREQRRVYHRLGLLYHNNFVARVDDTNKYQATRRGVFWLTGKGAQHVALRLGGDGDLKDFPFKSGPKWQSLAHDLRLNDIRLKVMADVNLIPGAVIHEWVSDYEFHLSPDVVKYQTTLRKGRERVPMERSKEVMPDGYCSLTIPIGEGKMSRYRFLIEMDMATETRRGQFGRDKVLPLTAYLESDTYGKRFGKSGLILVVTTTLVRLSNIKAQAEEYGGKSYFYFTTYDQVVGKNILTDQIWKRSGDTELHTLITV